MKQLAHIDSDPAHDSLAIVAEQDRQLIEIFTGWDATTPGPDLDDTGTPVRSAYKRGAYGKLLIEHAALRIAAQRDVARASCDNGCADLADEFLRRMAEVHRLVDRLDELARVLLRICAALGSQRSELHGGHWARRHAPTHPAPRARWYTRGSMLLRSRARYNHLRGFPWAESAPMGDSKVADSFATES